MRRSILLLAILLPLLTGCLFTGREVGFTSQDWGFVQSVGGLRLGRPTRDGQGRISLPILCDISGARPGTTQPRKLNSGLACAPPAAEVQGSTVLITIRTSAAGYKTMSSRCPPADLGVVPAGTYTVAYRGPDGGTQPLGPINIP